MMLPRDCYIGFDEREPKSYMVTDYSMGRRSSIPLRTKMLDQKTLRSIGLYDRPFRQEGLTRIDERDGKPFSTDFSFTRFLVPALSLYEGWALFCDGDFLFLDDVAKLFALADDRYAVMCVKHEHAPTEETKMDGRAQTRYFRKNWSSLVLWNCSHPSNRRLTPERVNTESGQSLHAFSWLLDMQIGELPGTWNYLAGIDNGKTPSALHFTLGTPEFEKCRGGHYAGLWMLEYEDFMQRATAA
jgi:lipopolysaccharide biosynthesis glycosyltransferase